jgi:hypothetical protein
MLVKFSMSFFWSSPKDTRFTFLIVCEKYL